jgi:hypothetical protein
MGLAAMATLLYTRGNITMLVVMYSINVFLTFTLTELGMSLHWIKERNRIPAWKQLLAIHGTGLVMCVSILAVTLYEKFAEGGWMTVLITGATVALCFMIHRHYRTVSTGFTSLDTLVSAVPLPEKPITDPTPMNHEEPTGNPHRSALFRIRLAPNPLDPETDARLYQEFPVYFGGGC